jgi:predicted phage terminase large subunit-like protein
MPQEIRPQAGPQTTFLRSSADIAIYGGAAGGGKSWALLLEPLRHVQNNKNFYTVIFRRTLADAKKPGSTWDQMGNILPLAGGRPNISNLSYNFPKGGKVTVGHLEQETSVLDWQGAEVPLICFDELTHFTRNQFFYMLSRNRSTCGVRPYIRATCNPDPDSFVADLIAWWIDQETGYPIVERGGIVRWFCRVNDKLSWGDARKELVDLHGPECEPKSFTFIPSTIYDNPALLKQDPGYLANLKALDTVTQARLLGGNWKIRPAAGLYFRREWVQVVDIAPSNIDVVRYWDLAATEYDGNNDPDWTVGWKMGRCRDTKRFFVFHVYRDRVGPFEVRQALKNLASSDGTAVRVGLPQDPGQAGKAQAKDMVLDLAGYSVSARPERGDKVTRFSPFSAQCKAGNVLFVRGVWNEAVFCALESFDGNPKNHDDDADAAGGAFGMFTDNTTGLLDFFASQSRGAKQENG